MNIEFTALTRPRIASGVSSCTSMLRTNTLTMSPAPAMASATSESQKLVDRPKVIVHTPKSATPPNIQRARVPLDGPHAEPERDDGRADAGRGAHQAEPDGVDVQDLVRIHRQQRDHAAEQHREQVQRDGAEHGFLVPHEHEAAEHIAPVPFGGGLRAAPASRPAIMNIAAISRATAMPYDQSMPRISVMPPIAGPVMVAMVNSSVFMEMAPDNSSLGTRLGTMACPAGAQKARPTPNNAAMKNNRIDLGLPGQREQQQRRGGEQLEPVGQRDDEAAVEAVGDLPAGQQQHDERQELREADVARGRPRCASASTPGSRAPRRSSARPACAAKRPYA